MGSGGNRFREGDTSYVAEGRGHEHLRNMAIYSPGSDGPLPTFQRFVVLEVLSDPSVLDKTKLAYLEHEVGVANIGYARVAPRNSIIARRVMGMDSCASEKTLVLYPFFPPPLALPAKPGEHVWGMYEHPDARANDLGYWMCRIVQPNYVEDVNYTHADRQMDSSLVNGIIDAFEGTADPKYEFRNGAVGEVDGQRFGIAETVSLPHDEHAYEKLLTETDACKQVIYEPVPRYRKRPSDTAFEGSNNTLIVLGTDRTGPVSDYDTDPDKGKIPKPTADDDPNPGCGMIDLVVGRGQTSVTSGNSVDNKILGFELGKTKLELVDNEGDPDLKNDRSRVMISQRTKPDKNLSIDTIVLAHTSALPITDSQGEGAVIVKTDKIRYVARTDVVIMVTGPGVDKNGKLNVLLDENGNVKDPDPNPDNCASITIRANGDIIFTPAKHGIIKLGGDDANIAILGTHVNNGGVGGSVLAEPLIDAMGGYHGSADGLNGIFASKILMK